MRWMILKILSKKNEIERLEKEIERLEKIKVNALDYVAILKNRLDNINDLCEAEIESKGRFGANQKILEIQEMIHE